MKDSPRITPSCGRAGCRVHRFAPEMQRRLIARAFRDLISSQDSRWVAKMRRRAHA